LSRIPPHSPGQIARRRQLIRELLRSDRFHSQEQLRTKLREAGIRAEQATLSRDLHALGVVKGPDGYILPDAPVSPTPSRGELTQLLRQFLVSAEHTGVLVVLRTGPGRAQPVGLALDAARLRAVLGTIAGDDTIFVAARSPALAERFAEFCRDVAGGLSPSDLDFAAFDAEPAAQGAAPTLTLRHAGGFS